MGMTSSQYIRMLKGLFPRGRAWNTNTTSIWHKMLDAMAAELVRIDGRADDLLNEADPSTATELLTEWERIVQLPDHVQTALSGTLAQRRLDVLRKLTLRGGQSRQFFIDMAAAFGYTVRIEEPAQFRVGRNRCGDRLYGEGWLHYFFIWSTVFTVGNTTLESVVGNAKPAHTEVLFYYGG